MRFVWTLRKQTRDNRTRTAGGFSNITVTKQQHTVVEADNGDIMVSDSSMPAAETQRGDTEVTFNVPSISTNRLTAGTTTFNNDGPSRNHTASNGTHMRQHSDAVALARLASDLSLSVPLIAVIAIFFVVAGVLGLLKSGVSPEWSWTELVGRPAGLQYVTYESDRMLIPPSFHAVSRLIRMGSARQYVAPPLLNSLLRTRCMIRADMTAFSAAQPTYPSRRTSSTTLSLSLVAMGRRIQATTSRPQKASRPASSHAGSTSPPPRFTLPALLPHTPRCLWNCASSTTTLGPARTPKWGTKTRARRRRTSSPPTLSRSAA